MLVRWLGKFLFESGIVARNAVYVSYDHLADRRRIIPESLEGQHKNLRSAGRASCEQLFHHLLTLFGGIVSVGYLPIAYGSMDADHDVSLVDVDGWHHEVPADQSSSGSMARLRRAHANLVAQRKIRRMSPKLAHAIALRCPHDCG